MPNSSQAYMGLRGPAPASRTPSAPCHVLYTPSTPNYWISTHTLFILLASQKFPLPLDHPPTRLKSSISLFRSSSHCLPEAFSIPSQYPHWWLPLLCSSSTCTGLHHSNITANVSVSSASLTSLSKLLTPPVRTPDINPTLGT